MKKASGVFGPTKILGKKIILPVVRLDINLISLDSTTPPLVMMSINIYWIQIYEYVDRLGTKSAIFPNKNERK